MNEDVADIPLVEAYQGAVTGHPELGLLDTVGACEGFRRRHGQALIDAGIVYQNLVGRRWMAVAGLFEPAFLHIVTGGRRGTDPVKLAEALVAQA